MGKTKLMLGTITGMLLAGGGGVTGGIGEAGVYAW